MIHGIVASSIDKDIYFYKRFVDDVLMHIDSRVQMDHICGRVNSFDRDILCTHEPDTGTRVNFLDLDISIESGVVFKTYRKPTCVYNYKQSSSCHSLHVKRAILAIEIVRLLRTNSSEGFFLHAVEFTIGKFMQRGYPPALLHEIADKYPGARSTVYCSAVVAKQIAGHLSFR